MRKENEPAWTDKGKLEKSLDNQNNEATALRNEITEIKRRLAQEKAQNTADEIAKEKHKKTLEK